WSASHPWTAIAAWLGAVVVLMVTGHLAGTVQLPYGAQNVGPSGQAEQMISRAFPRHAVEDVLFDSPGLRVGDPAYRAAISDVLSDLHRAELLSFPITLVVLLIAFGAVVAALLPLGLATVAILAAGGLVAFTSRLSGVGVQATSVMLLIGLAVGVDYSMFYVK